jgi:hypothetical protein
MGGSSSHGEAPLAVHSIAAPLVDELTRPVCARLLAALAIGSGLFGLGCERGPLFTEPTVLPAPTAATISPSSGIRGTTVRVTIVGTDFVTGGTTVAVSGSDVTVSNVSVDGTPPGPQASVSADLVIAIGATTGARQVTVTTSFGTSNALTFTIHHPVPTLSAITPAVGTRGTTAAVTLTGTHFVVGETTVAVSGSGVTVNTVAVGSSTSLTASFVLDAGAEIGARNVTVTTPGGTSGARSFTIDPPPPTLASVSPTSGVQGTTVSVTLTGTDFISGGTTVAVSGSNVTVSNVSVTSGTSLTASFAVGSTAALGDRTVTVTTVGGTSGTRTFTVNPPAPTLTSVSPTSGVQGTTVSVTLTGTNFISGATTVAVSGTGVTVSNVSVASGTSLTADFVIAANATTGGRNVTVTTAGGTSGAQTFTVNVVADPQEVPITP